MKAKIEILDRYVITEMIPPFFTGIFAFIVVLITDLLFTLTDMIINKGIPFFAVLKLLVFKLPAIMVLTFPVSTLFATAMAIGRFSHDNEIVAMRTSGVSMFRIAAPIMIFSLIVSLASFSTNEFLAPWCNQVSENIIRQIILKQPLVQIKENVFFKDKGNRFFYVKRVDTKSSTLFDIMIYELSGDTMPRVIIAKRAKYGGGFWDMEEGIINKFEDDGSLAYEASFKQMRIVVSEEFLGYLGYNEQRTTQEMSSQELIKLIGVLNKGGVNTRSLMVDYYMKFSIPLSCFVFALVGIPLSLPGIRAGRAFGIVLSIFIMFSFYVFASVSRSLGYGGVLAPTLAAFMPQVTFTVLGGGLFLREALVK